MFSGIVETMTRLKALSRSGSNITFTFSIPKGWTVKEDQSISHNGVCLTVEHFSDGEYTVTAMDETLRRSNLGELNVGDYVNLERSMMMDARLDGHIVQGHVDRTAVCSGIEDADGSTVLTFTYKVEPDDAKRGYVIVEKGSVAVNGVSLTAYDIENGTFKVSIIPYTSEITNLGKLKKGDVVNLEFDILGKYLAKMIPGLSALFNK